MYFLYINVEDKNNSFVALLNESGLLDKHDVDTSVGLNEQLLILIDRLLVEKKITKEQISVIAVNNNSGTFSSLRAGIVTANALAYSLKIPVISIDKNQSLEEVVSACLLKVNSEFKPVFPVYDREPNISVPKV